MEKTVDVAEERSRFVLPLLVGGGLLGTLCAKTAAEFTKGVNAATSDKVSASFCCVICFLSQIFLSQIIRSTLLLTTARLSLSRHN